MARHRLLPALRSATSAAMIIEAALRLGTLARMRRRDGYRPERHYMRGPGPKWREKHDGATVR